MPARASKARAGQVLLALVSLPGAVGQAEEPCARVCGRELSCGALKNDFTCDALSCLGCDCAGCCLASLSPVRRICSSKLGLAA